MIFSPKNRKSRRLYYFYSAKIKKPVNELVYTLFVAES